jgi:hypothetical protein
LIKESEPPRGIELGGDIIAIGFGKYNYGIHNFRFVDLLLPTIMRGIISKTITINSTLVAFKTDANLYHGFSGCGIWRGHSHIGMAVFIIKNITTLSHLTKHNFSYSSSFLRHSLCCDK